MNRFLTFVAAAITILGFTRVAWADGLSTQDYIDIEQLYSTYNHAIDSGDGEAWAATFTPDGTFNKFAGHDQLVGFIQQWKEKMSGGNRRHWNTNLRIVPSKDGASASVFLMLVGGGLNVQVASRVLLKGFGGVGQNKYPIAQPSGGVDVQRLD